MDQIIFNAEIMKAMISSHTHDSVPVAKPPPLLTPSCLDSCLKVGNKPSPKPLDGDGQGNGTGSPVQPQTTLMETEMQKATRMNSVDSKRCPVGL